MPTPVDASNQGYLTDRSGTITAGGTAQVVMVENEYRNYLFMQNVSSGDLWINFGATAVASQPSIRLVPGDSFTMEQSFVSVESVSIIGATTGQAYSAREA